MTLQRASMGLLSSLAALMLLLLYVPCANAAQHVAGLAHATGNPISVYGAWACSNDACIWGTVRSVSEFDSKNHWLIDRGDGVPSVNLVVLSFVQPLKLLNKTTDAQTSQGVPVGMTADIVNYFKSHNVRVMLSIGGITYADYWDQALATNPTQLGLNAAAVAQQLGVGMEIDYENSSSPNLDGLQAFINAYRSQEPYDPTGANPAARLTIDLAAGDRWLIPLATRATTDWLTTTNPVLDYANAMVPSKQPSTSSAEANWQEHIDGKSQYNPPIPALAPAKLAGSMYISDSKGNSLPPECYQFSGSLIQTTATYVQTVAPNGAGTTSGMLGFMFWAAECPSSRGACTTPPNSCTGGVGVGSSTFNIPVPMPALRQS
ncbi:MAG TPA: hypothetical protein VHD63_00135 [Ktedonobacteraceae bacterium]|nr:hypothetical protein [Ktedonobacteraceae bacterium]